MNRLLKEDFQSKRNKFVPYIMAGDPSMEATIDIALALQDAGVDAIEWGIPFSDPLADGPVIQAAGERARSNGMNIIKAIEGVKEARRKGLTIPVILFTYVNPVLAYGEDNLIEEMKSADIDGLLIPDLPIEESEKIRISCKDNGISFISLVTLSSKSRLEKICTQGDGFIYFVSSLGVTGTRNQFSEDLSSSIAAVKEFTSVPVLIGFGISKKEHVQSFNQISDGVIVGSALVSFIGTRNQELLCENDRKKAVDDIKEFVVELIS
ncbi:tryptophan synthase subunit alpha [Evansella cellulosilytica]|uniref:Tryptophan synthase alpha chain n=1 Tax=Evansella cellulosilytica (strain ATCC 21833 / DSM 2522 / FERM P-1141 / JCM 9156 / N-4) TaxID=649639 RepID=E6TZG8_EVAC2|nr:tryptophan synthase subunit alpha [Evansella cellulosilytica]ADU30142.1 tryptophan synthase, alpha subunit [Evansella cellulosilytica DSM 2522]